VGDDSYRDEALERVRQVIDYADGAELDVCMDILLYRLTRVGGGVKSWLIGYIADILDCDYDKPVGGQRESKDFDFLLVPVLSLLEDLALENNPIAGELVDKIGAA